MSWTPTEKVASVARDGLVAEAPVEKTRELQELEAVSIISEDSRVVVEWEEGDAENPLNWSRLKRWYITSVASLLVFNATLASSAPSGIVPVLAAQYHMSHTVGVLTISLFVAGFCVGPMLWAPLSEQYGRKPVFIGTLSIFILTQVGNALSRNTASILVFRLLGGIFAAAPVTNSGAIVSDIWDAGTRGKAMTLYAIMPFTGPAIGPTISGFLNVAHVDWRWLFWILTIMGGLNLALVIFTLPETYKPVLLRHKAERLNKEHNDVQYIAPIDLATGSVWEKTQRILLKPFVILFHEPMLMAITAYMSFLYGCIYLLIQAYPTVFTRDHHLNPGVSGLMLLNLPIGSMISVVPYLMLSSPRYQRKIGEHAPSPVPPEARLDSMVVACAALFAASFFWFGWSSYPHISFVAPLLSGVLTGFSLSLLFLGLFNYVVDAYLPVAASALASINIFRNLAGAGFPLFATQMYEQLNPRWASTLLGLVAAVMAPIPIVLVRYGPRLRKNSKYCPSPVHGLDATEKDQEIVEDEESLARSPTASLSLPPLAKLPSA